MGEEWKPSVAKFMMYIGEDGILTVLVDPGYPSAWRQPKYYSYLKTLAAARQNMAGQLTVVRCGKKFTVILADRDEELKATPESLHLALEKLREAF